MATFKDAKHAEYHHVGKLLFTFAKTFIKDSEEDAQTVLKCINSVKTLDLYLCSDDVKRNFWARAKRINNKNYHELVRQNKKNSFSSVQIKMKRGVVRELVVIDAEGSDCSLVVVKGKIPLNKLGEVINSQSKKKKK
ncbi:hypothetical protein JCM15124A_15200 [Prevotella falsenii]